MWNWCIKYIRCIWCLLCLKCCTLYQVDGVSEVHHEVRHIQMWVALGCMSYMKGVFLYFHNIFKLSWQDFCVVISSSCVRRLVSVSTFWHQSFLASPLCLDKASDYWFHSWECYYKIHRDRFAFVGGFFCCKITYTPKARHTNFNFSF